MRLVPLNCWNLTLFALMPSRADTKKIVYHWYRQWCLRCRRYNQTVSGNRCIGFYYSTKYAKFVNVPTNMKKSFIRKDDFLVFAKIDIIVELVARSENKANGYEDSILKPIEFFKKSIENLFLKFENTTKVVCEMLNYWERWCRWTHILNLYMHTYIIPFSQDYGLASHTNHVVCVNFIREWWNLQFNVDSELQICEKFFSWQVYLLSGFLTEICWNFWWLTWDTNPDFCD